MTGERERLVGDAALLPRLIDAKERDDAEAVADLEERARVAAGLPARVESDTSTDPVDPWMREANAATSDDDAARIVREALGLSVTLDTLKDSKKPEAVIWRDPKDGTDYRDPILAVGEVAVLAGAGGVGKSNVAMALAAEAWRGDGRQFGASCGLRVKAGPVAFLSYEDSPTQLGRMASMYAAGGSGAGIHTFRQYEPLWAMDRDTREAVRSPFWPHFWQEVEHYGCTLAVIDPLSATFSGADLNDGGAVRGFLTAVRGEAQRLNCGVLLLAHDTKGARSELKGGGSPGPGAVAGSSQITDGVRGAFHLARYGGSRVLQCIKANYAGSHWGAVLCERTDEDGRGFHGFTLAEHLDAVEVSTVRKRLDAAAETGTGNAKANTDAVPEPIGINSFPDFPRGFGE